MSEYNVIVYIQNEIWKRNQYIINDLSESPNHVFIAQTYSQELMQALYNISLNEWIKINPLDEVHITASFHLYQDMLMLYISFLGDVISNAAYDISYGLFVNKYNDFITSLYHLTTLTLHGVYVYIYAREYSVSNVQSEIYKYLYRNETLFGGIDNAAQKLNTISIIINEVVSYRDITLETLYRTLTNITRNLTFDEIANINTCYNFSLDLITNYLQMLDILKSMTLECNGGDIANGACLSAMNQYDIIWKQEIWEYIDKLCTAVLNLDHESLVILSQ